MEVVTNPKANTNLPLGEALISHNPNTNLKVDMAADTSRNPNISHKVDTVVDTSPNLSTNLKAATEAAGSKARAKVRPNMDMDIMEAKYEIIRCLQK